jgi:hypothetical protein
MRVHGRQFVIGPRMVEPDATWTHRALGELILSNSDWLPVDESDSRLELGVHVSGRGRWIEITDEV